MSDKFEYGPLVSYEVRWTSGHTETVQAHQVTLPMPDGLFGHSTVKVADFINFHAEIDGRWRLVLAVRPDEISSIRDKATEDVL